MKKQKAVPLRFSVPPYCVAVVGELPMFNMPGRIWRRLDRCFAPSAAECQRMLVRLRAFLDWSRPTLAAFLGTPEATVRRWETGQRNPSGASRRLIWLVDMLIRRPQQFQCGLDFLLWGQGEKMRKLMEVLRQADSTEADGAEPMPSGGPQNLDH